jgi:S-methylmethionine-dependent homocysteine/selenocysteine methylase
MAVQAQSNQSEIEVFQTLFGMEKRAVVDQLLQLDSEKSTSFWSLYDSYEMERKLIANQRISNINEYIENYGSFTDEKLDELVKRSVSINKSLSKLELKYYKKIKKEVGSKTAAQFYQLEGYFKNAVRMLLFESLPFIGEMDLINSN